MCKIKPEENFRVINLLSNMAFVCGNIGNYQKSLELYDRCYIFCSKLIGEKQSSTLIILNNLANIYMELDEYQKALELFEKCYDLRRKVLGEEHPDTLETLEALKIVREKLQN